VDDERAAFFVMTETVPGFARVGAGVTWSDAPDRQLKRLAAVGNVQKHAAALRHQHHHHSPLSSQSSIATLFAAFF